MTDKEREETLKRLKARLACDKRQVKGNADICNPPYMCEECDLCYAQGTLGERNTDLARAIEVLSVEAIPIDWIDGYIKRRVKVAGLYAEMLYIIDMLKEWENENGKE